MCHYKDHEAIAQLYAHLRRLTENAGSLESAVKVISFAEELTTKVNIGQRKDLPEVLDLLMLLLNSNATTKELKDAISFADFLANSDYHHPISTDTSETDLKPTPETPEAIAPTTSPDPRPLTPVTLELQAEAIIINLLHDGYTSGAIAAAIGVSPQWIGRTTGKNARKRPMPHEIALRVFEIDWDDIPKTVPRTSRPKAQPSFNPPSIEDVNKSMNAINKFTDAKEELLP